MDFFFYTLFKADGFSYIFDNTFNGPNVVFSLMMLNVVFLDSVNQINPKAWRSLSFHSSTFMYPASPPKGVSKDLSDTYNLQPTSSRNWYRIHQTSKFLSLNFPSLQIVVNLASLWYQLLGSHNNAHTQSKWTQRTW